MIIQGRTWCFNQRAILNGMQLTNTLFPQPLGAINDEPVYALVYGVVTFPGSRNLFVKPLFPCAIYCLKHSVSDLHGDPVESLSLHSISVEATSIRH
jgi:hypothetical protein